MDKELKEKLFLHLEDRRGDIGDKEIDDTIELIKDLVNGEKISSIDRSIIFQIIDDEKLQEEIDKITVDKISDDPF